MYIPEQWILPSFMEAAYMVNRARDAKDPRGMVSLAWIHKRSPFYPDISFWEYKQHLTILPLMPPTEDGLGLCGYAKNFAVGALHWRPDNFGKDGEITFWAPPGQLSSEGSDSDIPEGTDNASKSANPENSGMGPPVLPEVPDEEPSAPPGMPSLDQVPGNGQNTPVPTELEVNPPDPDTSAPDLPPMPADQTKPPLPNPPDSSTTAVSGLGLAAPPGLPVIPTTSTAIQNNNWHDTYHFAGVMNGLKEVCSIMTTGFQCACLDVETIVHKLLEGATQLNQNITEAATQDLNTWASALQPVLDSAGVSDTDMEARRGHARKTGWEISNRILSLLNPVVRNQSALGEPVKTALLESFAVANAQCSHSWEVVADRIPDIMTRHVPVDQTQMFLAAMHQLLCTQYQAITTMVATQTGPPVRLGMYNWGTQVSLIRLLAQAIPALRSLEHAMPVNPSSSLRPTPQPQ